jgi:hypothetical protein
MKRLTSIFLVISSISSAYANYYKTLPKGVRLMAYRHVQTSTVKSSYNHTNKETPFSYEFKASGELLEELDELKPVMEAMKALSPEAYDQFSLGTYKIEADARVNVNALGVGYGITNKLTGYVGIPYYNAHVDVRYKRVKGNNYSQVADTLANTGNTTAQSFGDAVENMVDVNENVIQSAAINTLGYEEVGQWDGEGLGDTELGFLYNLTDDGRKGTAVTFGLVAPTGYVEDPDIIQDVGFGDGQWDGFLEYGGGINVTNSLAFNSFFRYTYQFASEKTLRVPYDQDVQLSDKKGDFYEKRGNKFDYVFESTYSFNDWVSITPGYEFNYQEKSEYISPYVDANEFLAANTEKLSHSLRLAGTVSSIQPFLKKNFILPATINLKYQHMMFGKNTPKVDRIELELRMLF